MRVRPVVLMSQRNRPTHRKASDATSPHRAGARWLVFKKAAIRPNGEHPSLGPTCKTHRTQLRRLRLRVDGVKVKRWVCRRCDREAAQ